MNKISIALACAAVLVTATWLAFATPSSQQLEASDEDHPVGGSYDDVNTYQVWSVGTEPATVPVWKGEGTHDLSQDIDHTWYNWTSRSEGGDVRFTIYPPGCESMDCAIVDDTSNGPVHRSIRNPDSGAWTWTVVSVTPTVDRYQVVAIREADVGFIYPT